jgi:hypothetical protein
MPNPQRHSWHHGPDIANLSPESFTAQKLVGKSLSLCDVELLTAKATRDA